MSKWCTDCDVFEFDTLLKENYGISESKLRNGMNKTLLEIKKYFNVYK